MGRRLLSRQLQGQADERWLDLDLGFLRVPRFARWFLDQRSGGRALGLSRLELPAGPCQLRGFSFGPEPVTLFSLFFYPFQNQPKVAGCITDY